MCVGWGVGGWGGRFGNHIWCRCSYFGSYAFFVSYVGVVELVEDDDRVVVL